MCVAYLLLCSLFHIDFGHFLGNFMKWKGFSRERAPFTFTPEFAYVLGGRQSPLFAQFVELACDAFVVLRRYANDLIALLAIMVTTGTLSPHSSARA